MLAREMKGRVSGDLSLIFLLEELIEFGSSWMRADAPGLKLALSPLMYAAV
jgi:hypothetical protein